MRITKSLLLSALFTLVLGTTFAKGDPAAKSARTEIKEMITKADFAKEISEDVTLNVRFQVNGKNEIIIISTDNDKYDASLKDVLNYKKLKSSDMSINMIYTLPIKLKK